MGVNPPSPFWEIDVDYPPSGFFYIEVVGPSGRLSYVMENGHECNTIAFAKMFDSEDAAMDALDAFNLKHKGERYIASLVREES